MLEAVVRVPQSALEWVLLLAIASSGLCMLAVLTMLIVNKYRNAVKGAGADGAVHTVKVVSMLGAHVRPMHDRSVSSRRLDPIWIDLSAIVALL